MSTLDDLKSAGFSDSEVNSYATEQSHTLSAAGFSDDEITAHLGARPQPNTLWANQAFSRVIGDALTTIKGTENVVDKAGAAYGAARSTIEPAMEMIAGGPVASALYAPMEAALNAGTGMLFGFPAYIGAGLGGLISKHLLGSDADPAELASTMQKIFTFEPLTQRGRELAGNVMMPLTKLQEGAEWVGHKTSDVATRLGASGDTASALGAVTDATIQMLGPVLLGELGRKMGGQTVTAADMKNAAKVIAPDAHPATAATVENGLRAIYEKTGIGPFTVMDEAKKNPQIIADLANPAVEIPQAFARHVWENEGGRIKSEEPTPGDGAPLLDVSGPTLAESQAALARGEPTLAESQSVMEGRPSTLGAAAPTLQQSQDRTAQGKAATDATMPTWEDEGGRLATEERGATRGAAPDDAQTKPGPAGVNEPLSVTDDTRAKQVAAYEDARERFNEMVPQLRDARAANNAGEIKRLTDAMRPLDLTMRRLQYEVQRESLAKSSAQYATQSAERYATMPIGSLERPSEFSADRGLHWEKTAPNTWEKRGSFGSDKITSRTDAQMDGTVSIRSERAPELQEEISMRKRQSVLKSLLECMT